MKRAPEKPAKSERERPTKPRGTPNGIWARLWRRGAETEARAALAQVTPRQREDLGRAIAARHFADLVARPVDPPALGSPLPAALVLHRSAAFWALAASLPDPPPADAAAALDRLPAAESTSAAAENAALERAALVDPETAWARRPEAELRDGIARLAALTERLLAPFARPERRLRRIVLGRVALGVAAIALVAGGAVAVSAALASPSLTRGKPWRASSTQSECHPQEHDCGGFRTDIFFHTTEEDSPWVEIDLGEPRPFHKLVVENRTDCCPDRAVPLAFEISDDATNWKQVARRDNTFRTWAPAFPTERARYIRLRSLRRTLLHLEAVDLY